MRTPLTLLTLLSFLASIAPAHAQWPGSAGPPGLAPLEELLVTPQQESPIALAPGMSATVAFLLTNAGEAQLDLTLVVAGSGGGFGGRPGGASAGGVRGGEAPPEGAAPSGAERPDRSDPNRTATPSRARVVNATLEGDANRTLAPGESSLASFLLAVSPDAGPGDHPMTFLVRERESNRTSLVMTLVRVVDMSTEAQTTAGSDVGATVEAPPGSAQTPGAPIASVFVASAVLALLRRRPR
jgi:uncharacterized protein (TIGR03382 family)